MLAPRPGRHAAPVDGQASLTDGSARAAPSGCKMSRATYRVALLGFSDFERRDARVVLLRLAAHARARLTSMSRRWTRADFLLADADHAAVGATGARPPSAGRDGLHRQPGAGRRGGLDNAADRPAAGDARARCARCDALPRRRPTAPARAHHGSATGAAVPRRACLSQRRRHPRARRPGLGRSAPAALLVDDSEVALRFLASRCRPWAGGRVRGQQQPARSNGWRSRPTTSSSSMSNWAGDSELDGLALCQHIKRLATQRPATGGGDGVGQHSERRPRARRAGRLRCLPGQAARRTRNSTRPAAAPGTAGTGAGGIQPWHRLPRAAGSSANPA